MGVVPMLSTSHWTGHLYWDILYNWRKQLEKGWVATSISSGPVPLPSGTSRKVDTNNNVRSRFADAWGSGMVGMILGGAPEVYVSKYPIPNISRYSDHQWIPWEGLGQLLITDPNLHCGVVNEKKRKKEKLFLDLLGGKAGGKCSK